MKLRVEDVQGRACLTQFWGMDYTTDTLRAMVRKWQSLIEAHVDVKTTDGYTLRMFAIAFTKKRPGQIKKTAYAKSALEGYLAELNKASATVSASMKDSLVPLNARVTATVEAFQAAR